LIQIGSRHRMRRGREEEDPVVVVEVAVGAGHILAFEVGATRLSAELKTMGART